MMEKYQRPPYNGTLREAEGEEDQKVFGEDRVLKNGEKLERTKCFGS
jgi:hypothetical protein